MEKWEPLFLVIFTLLCGAVITYLISFYPDRDMTDSNLPVCEKSGCNNHRMIDRPYCSNHACIRSKCQNEKTHGKFCEKHYKLKKERETANKVTDEDIYYDSQKNKKHECYELSCNHVTFNDYCPDHTCKSANCYNHRDYFSGIYNGYCEDCARNGVNSKTTTSNSNSSGSSGKKKYYYNYDDDFEMFYYDYKDEFEDEDDAWDAWMDGDY